MGSPGVASGQGGVAGSLSKSVILCVYATDYRAVRTEYAVGRAGARFRCGPGARDPCRADSLWNVRCLDARVGVGVHAGVQKSERPYRTVYRIP